jgi:hypothetical protein
LRAHALVNRAIAPNDKFFDEPSTGFIGNTQKDPKQVQFRSFEVLENEPFRVCEPRH